MSKVSLRPSIEYFWPYPLVLVTCADEEARPNIIALAAASPCSYAPPTIGIAVSPRRHSHRLIAERGEFGVNLPSQADLERADRTGCLSGRDHDKFAETGFTARPGEVISVPLIEECPISFECRLLHTVPLGSHDWFVGEIVAAHADAALSDGKGGLDLTTFQGVVCAWGQYLTPGAVRAPWHFTATRGK